MIRPAFPPVPHLAVICDLEEEGWHSMTLVADMLLHSLQRDHAHALAATRIQPSLRTRLTAGRKVSSARVGDDGPGMRARLNVDRFVNRFWDYPRLLRRTLSEFDLFHVVDHSYGQLVHHLPAERTVVTCHDLHTFRCLLEPREAPRSAPFRLMTRQILKGLSKAARVVFDTGVVRDEAVARGVVSADRAVVAHLGVHPACTPEPDADADAEAARLLGSLAPGAVPILHVGATYGRKRLDLLLRIFAEVRRAVPGATLVRVGGGFLPDQAALARELGLTDSVVVLPFLERGVLSAVYRRAALVVLPSEEEGFGLPVLEAMTCGTPVVASDLPVLREVGGEAVTFCPTGDVPGWRDTVVRLLAEREEDPAAWEERRQAGLVQAARFSWPEYGRKMVNVYQEVLAP